MITMFTVNNYCSNDDNSDYLDDIDDGGDNDDSDKGDKGNGEGRYVDGEEGHHHHHFVKCLQREIEL